MLIIYFFFLFFHKYFSQFCILKFMVFQSLFTWDFLLLGDNFYLSDPAAHTVAEDEEQDTRGLALLLPTLCDQWPGVLLHGGHLGPGPGAEAVANVVVAPAQQTKGTAGVTKLKNI